MEFASTCVPQRILVLKDSPLFPKGTRLSASGSSDFAELLGKRIDALSPHWRRRGVASSLQKGVKPTACDPFTDEEA